MLYCGIRSTIFNLKVLFYVSLFAFASCDRFQQADLNEPSDHKIYKTSFGFLHNRCFVTSGKNISPGTDILLVLLNKPQSVSRAKVVGPANSKTCGPLAEDRHERNIFEGESFYEVKSSAEYDLAIGIIGDVSQSKVENGLVLADIGNDGNFERFTLCATSEGISFGIWNSKPYTDKPVWTGYYYLGYDVDRTCP